MRWDNLRVDIDEGHRLPGYKEPAVIRRFDAPEAMDIRFYEVHAKSALNKVPEQSQVPFRWTINPYRGCTHACTYCVAGTTKVLMADGTTRPVIDLRAGDQILGTETRTRARDLVPTKVLDQWSTTKAGHLVELEDGTELVASGDHRFLTDHGWKHVAPAEDGEDERPVLEVGSQLVGVGASANDPLGPHAGLRVAHIEPYLDEMPLFDITTGTGDFIANGVVSHNCFARPTHKYLDFDAGRDFEREIVVKVNVPEVLRRELAKPSWKGEHVALGTNTDPYQWVEGRYKLMPGIWEAFRDFRNPCSVLTKSPLLLRDLPLLKEISEVAPISASFSVPTLDEKAWRATEPHTPNPRARLEAIGELNRAGIPCGVLIAPLMPGINDSPEQVEPILEMAAEAGAVSVGGIALHLRGEVRQVFFEWLESYRPDLLPRYRELYKRGAYAPKEERARLQALARPKKKLREPSMPGRRYLADRDDPGFVRAEKRADRHPPPEQPALF